MAGPLSRVDLPPAKAARRQAVGWPVSLASPTAPSGALRGEVAHQEAPAAPARIARRGDLPALPPAHARGSMDVARAVLDSARKEGALRTLERAFHADSSRTAQCRKRIDVEHLARLAQGEKPIYPLRRETVLGVAAALKAAAVRSADQ